MEKKGGIKGGGEIIVILSFRWKLKSESISIIGSWCSLRGLGSTYRGRLFWIGSIKSWNYCIFIICTSYYVYLFC